MRDIELKGRMVDRKARVNSVIRVAMKACVRVTVI